MGIVLSLVPKIFYFRKLTGSQHIQILICIKATIDRSTVAKMVERVAVNPKIHGSNPAWFQNDNMFLNITHNDGFYRDDK